LPNAKDEQDGEPANLGVEDKEEDTADDACIAMFESTGQQAELWAS
jgi:hypothetical protein